MDIMQLSDLVRQTGFDLHGLSHRLRKKGLNVEQQLPLQVQDEDGTILGDYFADLFIDQRLIIEIKACRTIVDEHVAQLLGYLRAARVEHGLLINFGANKYQIRKYIWSPSHHGR